MSNELIILLKTQRYLSEAERRNPLLTLLRDSFVNMALSLLQETVAKPNNTRLSLKEERYKQWPPPKSSSKKKGKAQTERHVGKSGDNQGKTPFPFTYRHRIHKGEIMGYHWPPDIGLSCFRTLVLGRSEIPKSLWGGRFSSLVEETTRSQTTATGSSLLK